MMKKITIIFFLLSIFVFIRCAGPAMGLKNLEEPKVNSVIIVGNVIIENINQEFSFENWDYGGQAVIVGIAGGDTITHYTADIDAQGYYCLPNIPSGRYALKAVVLPVPGGVPLKLVNDLSSNNSEFYRMRHPELPIEYTAKWLTSKVEGRIINLGIVWLGMRTAEVSDLSVKSIGIIMTEKFTERLNSKRFHDYGYSYTREEPLTYFKKKFPISEWWKF